MITVTNARSFRRMEWDEYVAMPGYSYSKLRNPDGFGPPTAKMRLGTLVDRFLFTPVLYQGEQREIVEPMARELVRLLGNALPLGDSQLSLSADFTHEGLTMPYKGRPDFKITDLIVDLKVSQLNIVKAISFFRYDWQLSGYAKAAGCTRAMIVSIHPVTRKISMLQVPLVYDFWEHSIKKYGTPV